MNNRFITNVQDILLISSRH